MAEWQVETRSWAGEWGWRRRCTTLTQQVLVLALAVATEFGRANAATERYEQLRVVGDHNVSPARRVYVEFYAGQ
jgi:hypothetical protein